MEKPEQVDGADGGLDGHDVQLVLRRLHDQHRIARRPQRDREAGPRESR